MPDGRAEHLLCSEARLASLLIASNTLECSRGIVKNKRGSGQVIETTAIVFENVCEWFMAKARGASPDSRSCPFQAVSSSPPCSVRSRSRCGCFQPPIPSRSASKAPASSPCTREGPCPLPERADVRPEFMHQQILLFENTLSFRAPPRKQTRGERKLRGLLHKPWQLTAASGQMSHDKEERLG